MPTVLGVLGAILVIIIIFLVRGNDLAQHTWRCPNCGHGFKKNWFQMMLTPHINDSYGMKCPKCKKRDLFSHRD